MASASMNDRNNLFGYLFAAMVMFLAVQAWNHRAPEVTIDYSDFKVMLRAGQIQEANISMQAIKGKLGPNLADAKLPPKVREAVSSIHTQQPVAFVTLRIQDSDLLAELERAQVHYSAASDHSWLWQLVSLVAFLTPDYYDKWIEGIRQGGRKVLREAQAFARKRDVDAEPVFIEAVGRPAAVIIIEQAKLWPADLIVMGTHGRRGVRRMLMGSDAELVLRQSPVPVMLVREHVESTWTPGATEA